jgi:hypothetical protein
MTQDILPTLTSYPEPTPMDDAVSIETVTEKRPTYQVRDLLVSILFSR